jgi:hypothetical protein
MGKSERIFPRNCFVCSKPMTAREEGWPVLECADCEVFENGTWKGRHHLEPVPFEWMGEYITFIDHSKIYLPSPDVVSQAEPRRPACETVNETV